MSEDDILARARNFLSSPQVRYQDEQAKRKFLAEKGITKEQIDKLLAEQPLVPPRTYPQPPPSALPNLLLGLLRAFSWISGGSALLILVYHRFILPRIIRTQKARQSLRSHHLGLVQKLSESLRRLKEFQAESLASIPHQSGDKEPDAFAKCSSIEEVSKEAEARKTAVPDIPRVSLLRCALLDYSKAKDNAVANTEELFQLLEAKVPFLLSADGADLQHKLWETLSTSKVFESVAEDQDSASKPRSSRWKYIPPTPPGPSPLDTSLTELRLALQKHTDNNRPNPYQHTLQTLCELTGYLSAQAYNLHGYGQPDPTSSVAEEELKKEIRSLKGLVLNRRSFLPSTTYSTQTS